MRNFFVTWMERLLGLMVVLSVIGIGVAVWKSATTGQPDALLRAAGVALAGFVTLILTFGFAYVALAIHDNTRRTAAATEALLRGRQGAGTGDAPASDPRPGRGVLGPGEREAAGLPRRRPVVAGPAAGANGPRG